MVGAMTSVGRCSTGALHTFGFGTITQRGVVVAIVEMSGGGSVPGITGTQANHDSFVLSQIRGLTSDTDRFLNSFDL